MLEKEIRSILNRYCAENESNTPDFILAEYITGCLEVFNNCVNAREKWYGRGDGCDVDLRQSEGLDPEKFKQLAQRVLNKIPIIGSAPISKIVKLFNDGTGYGESDAKAAILCLKEEGKIIIDNDGNVSRIKG